MIYAAGSRALAALEMLIHLDDGSLLMEHYVVFAIDCPSGKIESLERGKLPRGWSQVPAIEKTRRIGDRWATELRSPVLQVPGAVVPAETNFLINPRHPSFKELKISRPESFQFDPRLGDG